MDKCKELTWSGFLSAGLPIAYTKHRTHRAAMREVAKDWRAWKKSATKAHLEKECSKKTEERVKEKARLKRVKNKYKE